MKKILTLVAIMILMVLVSVVINYFNIYSVGNSEREIQSLLNGWYEEADDKPLLLEAFSIGNSDTVVATFLHEEEQIGLIVFKKGLNQKLKLENRMDGQSLYSEFLETNRGRYVLFVGENQQLAIKTISTGLIDASNRKKIEIPPQRYFTYYEKAKALTRGDISPVFYYRTLQDAVDAASPDYRDMELMFVDEINQTFMLHSLIDNKLKTILGSFELEDGYSITTIEEPDSYSMDGDKTFCFEEKQVTATDKELTYLHGLISNRKQVKKVVLEIELEDEMIYQTVSDVKNQQFLLNIQIPDKIKQEGHMTRKFYFYDSEGKYLGTEMKL